MKRIFRNTLIVVALLGLVGCGSPGEGPIGDRPPGESAQSDKERVTAPDVPTQDMTKLVDGNSAFAFDLYQFLREKDGNLFYSPHSISLALAMTYAGLAARPLALNDNELPAASMDLQPPYFFRCISPMSIAFAFG